MVSSNKLFGMNIFKALIQCLKLSKSSIRFRYFNRRDKFGHIGKNSVIHNPSMVAGRENVYIGDNVNIDWNNVIFAVKGRFSIKKNCSIAIGCTFLTDDHKPELGSRLKDLGNGNLVPGEIIIDEDVWIGANVTLLSGVHISRGAIIGAGTVLKGKTVPPYAVVVGNPGKIIGFKLKPEDIIKHEQFLYPENERLSLKELEKNYHFYYLDRKDEIKKHTAF